ncbi:hypothetical protein IQ255_16905 [Pleurocapsales cyanobacterium LEGE 10410]|nr:hypothetical protein [Pleurocapsales cyanobacterium LEGE 10410]
MKDSERIQNEIITILLLILTLAFTSSNLTPETLEDRSLAEISPSYQTIY